MRGILFKRPIVILLTMAAVILFAGDTFAQKGSKPESRKLKLYISSIKANGVNEKLANRVKEGIRLAIFEGYGAKYQVIDDEAVRVMFRQAEAIMASGCDDTSCITQIADGINADEIVYGDVSPDGGKIAISVTSLERKGTSLGTKSIVMVSFLESQVDWVASESAKKLMNPVYKIDMSKAPETREDVKFSGIELKVIGGQDIAIIQFRSDDETVSKIIDYSKTLMAEGDQYFKNREYTKARARYVTVVDKVRTKLSADKQSQIKKYVDGIRNCIESSVLMEFKPEIETIDAYLNGIKDPGEQDLEKVLNKYIALEEEIKKIPYVEADGQGLTVIGERKDRIIIAIVSGYEKSGDLNYHDYKFIEARGFYRKARDRSVKIGDSAKKTEAVVRFDGKMDVTMKTGKGYLVNRIKSLVDQAEFYNFQDKTSNAKSTMKEAYKLITGPMKVLVTAEAVFQYNRMAEVVKIDSLTVDDLPEFFAEEKRIAADENYRKTGLYRIGDTGPAGGIIFYDKGDYSGGWRFLEAAPEDQSDGVMWCNGKSNLVVTGAADIAVGAGKTNTQKIIEALGSGNYAAKICADYRGGGKTDWFLPSMFELDLMFENLHKTGICSFGAYVIKTFYWSSSEYNRECGWVRDFSKNNRNTGDAAKYDSFHVRAIRSF